MSLAIFQGLPEEATAADKSMRHMAGLGRALRRILGRERGAKLRQHHAGIVPGYWRAIKEAESTLSLLTRTRGWLGSDDDIEWIRGYCGDERAEFVNPSATIQFHDGANRRARRILHLGGGHYVVEVAPDECWLGQARKDGSIFCFANYGPFFDVIEGR